jgi:hypothetical protein
MYLIDQGLDAKAKDGKGDTALHYAASGGSFESVKCVLQFYESGWTNSISWSPLHWGQGLATQRSSKPFKSQDSGHTLSRIAFHSGEAVTIKAIERGKRYKFGLLFARPSSPTSPLSRIYKTFTILHHISRCLTSNVHGIGGRRDLRWIFESSETTNRPDPRRDYSRAEEIHRGEAL